MSNLLKKGREFEVVGGVWEGIVQFCDGYSRNLHGFLGSHILDGYRKPRFRYSAKEALGSCLEEKVELEH